MSVIDLQPYVYKGMGRETPAGFSRNLHQQVKATRDALLALGYPPDTVYLLVMDVMMRLAFEDSGEDGVAKLLSTMDSKQAKLA